MPSRGATSGQARRLRTDGFPNPRGPVPVIVAERLSQHCSTAAALSGRNSHCIEHVGSTSVPGLAAKPIIDLDVVVAGTVPHRNHIDFRDFLRSHPVEAARYAALKLELAHLLGTDRPQYGARKFTMVQDFLAQTRAGASNQPAAVTAGA